MTPGKSHQPEVPRGRKAELPAAQATWLPVRVASSSAGAGLGSSEEPASTFLKIPILPFSILGGFHPPSRPFCLREGVLWSSQVPGLGSTSQSPPFSPMHGPTNNTESKIKMFHLLRHFCIDVTFNPQLGNFIISPIKFL